SSRKRVRTRVPSNVAQLHSPLREMPVGRQHLRHSPFLSQRHKRHGARRNHCRQSFLHHAEKFLLPELIRQPFLPSVESESRQCHALLHRSAFLVIEQSNDHPLFERRLHWHRKNLRHFPLE